MDSRIACIVLLMVVLVAGTNKQGEETEITKGIDRLL